MQISIDRYVSKHLTSPIHNAKICTTLCTFGSVLQWFAPSSLRLKSPFLCYFKHDIKHCPQTRLKNLAGWRAVVVRCGGLLTLLCTTGLLLVVEGTTNNGHSPLTLRLCMYRFHSSDFNTLRTGSFKLFKRPFLWLLTILTL